MRRSLMVAAVLVAVMAMTMAAQAVEVTLTTAEPDVPVGTILSIGVGVVGAFDKGADGQAAYGALILDVKPLPIAAPETMTVQNFLWTLPQYLLSRARAQVTIPLNQLESVTEADIEVQPAMPLGRLTLFGLPLRAGVSYDLDTDNAGWYAVVQAVTF